MKRSSVWITAAVLLLLGPCLAAADCPEGFQPILISGQTNVYADFGNGGEEGPDAGDDFMTFCYDPVNDCYLIIGSGELGAFRGVLLRRA